jgi:hypothetical protein
MLMDRLTLAIKRTEDLPSLCAVGGSEYWPSRLGSATDAHKSWARTEFRAGNMGGCKRRNAYGESLWNLEGSEWAGNEK